MAAGVYALWRNATTGAPDMEVHVATTKVNVRYMVDDVEAAIDFYTTHLGFTLLSSATPAFADVTRGDLRLLLSGATSSAGRAVHEPRIEFRQPAAGIGSNSS